MRAIKAGILGGIILFIWSAISWMALPWHAMTLHSFKDEKSVIQTLQTNVPTSGIYLIPSMQDQSNMAKNKEANTNPTVFASIHLEGAQPSMTIPMILGLIGQIIAAFFVAWLLCAVRPMNYFGRVGCVLLFAIASCFVTLFPYWDWFQFDMQYILVEAADVIIGWILAGLVMAIFCRNPA